MPTDPDIESLKTGLAAMWSEGDYGLIAKSYEASAEVFVHRMGIRPGERILDIACGTGQLAIPAARAGAEVTGIDLAEAWIRQARARAQTEGLSARFDVGDAEDLPYGPGAFDTVMSLIGVMFAPRPEVATAEMLRVCRPGGRIVLGNWTPDGFVAKFFATAGKYTAPPPETVPSPLDWGDTAIVSARLQDHVSSLVMNRQILTFDYPMPPDAVARHYAHYFGPTKQAAAALDPAARAALIDDLENLWEAHNTGPDGTTRVDAEILEIIAVKRPD